MDEGRLMVNIHADISKLRATTAETRRMLDGWRIKQTSSRRIPRMIWRVGCRMSNRIIRVDHCLYSASHRMVPVLNGQPAPQLSAESMISVLGWGAFRCHRKDRHGRIVASRSGGDLRYWRFGRVSLVEKSDTPTCAAIPIPRWVRPASVEAESIMVLKELAKTLLDLGRKESPLVS